MQVKLQVVERISTEQASQISTLREELNGSVAELDQVCLAECLMHTIITTKEYAFQSTFHQA